MNAILRVFAIFIVAFKRLVAQRGLALATSLGLVTAVMLTMSIPIYSDAIYQRIFERQISADSLSKEQDRPPYAFMFRYVGAWTGPVKWENLNPVENYMAGKVVSDLGLPRKLYTRYFKTDTFQLFPSDVTSYEDNTLSLSWISFATAADIENHITIFEGSFPSSSASSPDAPVEVLVNEELATELGLQVGESFTAYGQIDTEEGLRRAEIPVRVSGVWKPTDPLEDYWFYSVSEYETVLLVTETSFVNQVISRIDNEVYLALWYSVMDGSKVGSADVPYLLARIGNARQTATNLLPKIRLDVSPEDKLAEYLRSTIALNIFLYAFSVPILFMILTFIGLVVGMAIGQRRNEVAVLRSRGATTFQVVGMSILEGLLLGIFGLLIGAPTSQIIARFFGRTKSFLDFSLTGDLHTSLTLAALRIGAATILFALVALLLPAIGAARHTIVTYKQERARQLRPPWWQRAWLDFLLFIPAGYGAYLLRNQGSSVPGLIGKSLPNDPFQNPLLLLVPALMIFALTLFILRLLPLIMNAIAWFAGYTRSVGILLATRQLSRTAGGYHAPLILLILTLSLSTFTASLAKTLDRHLYDQTYYKVGADVNLDELGDFSGGFSSIVNPGSANTDQGQDTQDQEIRWFFLPVSEHLKVPGVSAAARVAELPATVVIHNDYVNGTFYGIDRVDFGQVAFWRQDFAPVSLGELMNELALTTEGVLVPRSFLVSNSLNPGDNIHVQIVPLGETTEIELKIVGVFDLFPTWYPDKGPLIVGNLDYLFEQAGGEFPYNVWLKTKPGAQYQSIIDGVRELYKRLLNWDVSALKVSDEQKRPERQGLFGLLSVGFITLALLTVLGFLLYALFSFQRRFIELGMLRAIGLSAQQMLEFLASELAFLILVGLGAGTGLGILVSNLFIPYLQVGDTQTARIPPFVVEINWPAIFQIYALFGLLFLIALVILGALLLRMKIFQAVKLGEMV